MHFTAFVIGVNDVANTPHHQITFDRTNWLWHMMIGDKIHSPTLDYSSEPVVVYLKEME